MYSLTQVVKAFSSSRSIHVRFAAFAAKLCYPLKITLLYRSSSSHVFVVFIDCTFRPHSSSVRPAYRGGQPAATPALCSTHTTNSPYSAAAPLHFPAIVIIRARRIVDSPYFRNCAKWPNFGLPDTREGFESGLLIRAVCRGPHVCMSV